jgi:inosine-uridine nucleoside N-ribohydrolase
VDASDAAAIASVCGALVGVVTVAGQVYLARQARATHKMVNGMASRRRRTDRAEGARLAGAADKPIAAAAMGKAGTPVPLTPNEPTP